MKTQKVNQNRIGNIVINITMTMIDTEESTGNANIETQIAVNIAIIVTVIDTGVLISISMNTNTKINTEIQTGKTGIAEKIKIGNTKRREGKLSFRNSYWKMCGRKIKLAVALSIPLDMR